MVSHSRDADEEAVVMPSDILPTTFGYRVLNRKGQPGARPLSGRD
jgi:hypothetical protein